MSSTTAPLAPPPTHTPGGTLIALPPTGGIAGSGGTSGTAAGGTTAPACITAAGMSTFNIPHGIHFPIFNGEDWPNWLGTMEAILVLYEADNVIRHASPPLGVDVAEWNSVHRRAKAYLRLYIKPDIYSHIASEVDYPTFKDKWDVLSIMYGGAVGSTALFNLWVSLISAGLDDAQPLPQQLAKLNDTRVTLHNASMGITDVQYSLLLLHALPPSYEVLVSTILASGAPSALVFAEITARILNEEGRRHGPSGSSSLNAARSAPIKGKGKARDHSNLTCHYCQQKGHIKPDCRKRKKDEADAKKKESSSGSGKKPANSHQSIHTTASIKEIDDDTVLVESFDNNEIGCALYAASRVRWMMDSGATHHITPHRSDFSDYTPCRGAVRLGDKSTISQVGVGSVVFTTSQGLPITLSNVLHLPEVKTRFLSTRALAQKGAQVSFDSGSFKISVKQKCIATGYLEANLYWLDASTIGLNTHTKSAATTLHTWHQRMGHISHNALKTYSPSATTGMDFNGSATTDTPVCSGCEFGKSTCQPFSASTTQRTSRIFEVVHSDLAGPMQTKSIQGSAYTATFIDNHSKLAVVYFLKSKDQFVKALQTYLAWGETQMSSKLRALHSDRGSEYMAGQVQDILKQRGIEHHLTMPGSPQSNGKAERFNRTIMDKAEAMRHTAGLSNGFWELAVAAAVHIYKRSPSRTTQWRPPHELW